MAPIKRPAAAVATGAAKKGRKASEEVTQKKAVQEQCKVVATAVLHNTTFPNDVVKMLSQNLTGCLSTVQEERHPFQVNVIEMVQAVLNSSEQSLQEALAEAEAKVAELEVAKTERHAAVEASTAVAASKTAETEAAKVAHTQTVHDVKDAKAVLSATKAASAAEDADFTNKESQKQHLETVLTSLGATATESLDVGASNTLVKAGKELALDTTLLGSLPSAVQKAPTARGSFDNIVIQQATQELTKHIEALAATLAAAEPSRAERAAKIESETATVSEKEALEVAAKEALKGAELAQKEAEDAQKNAAKALRSLGPETKQAKALLDQSKSNLQDFTDGALAAFQKLLVLSNVAVPKPEAEVLEPPADAEVVEPAAASEVPQLPVAAEAAAN